MNGDAGTGVGIDCVVVSDYVGTGFGEVIGGEENVLRNGNDAGDRHVRSLNDDAHEHGMPLSFLRLQRGHANAQPLPHLADNAGQRIDHFPHRTTK